MNLGIFTESLYANQQDHWKKYQRPWVTLSYAQSLDGSLTIRRGQPTAISGAASLTLTHQLRAMHDAILVGVGTVLADDPSLNVREVEGKDPVPAVLDGGLRMPLSAKLLGKEPKPMILHGPQAEEAKREALEAAGATLIQLRDGAGGLDLAEALDALGARGVRSIMVEGGAKVIVSFLAEGLVDWALITIAPVFIGGLKVLEELVSATEFPRLADAQVEMVGEDIVVWGRLSA